MHTHGCTDESEALADIKRLTPKELARQMGRDLVVPEETTVALSPSSREFAHVFARVRVTSFEDAQIMGFIPRKLSEEKVMRAIAEDDTLAYKMASRSYKPGGGCDCGQGEETHGKNLRGTYATFRRRNNPALAAFMAEKIGNRVDWDSPLVAATRKWAINSRAGLEVIASLFADITINRNATLAVASDTKTLWARDIWIHRTGKLVQNGSYLRVWANSLNSFSHFIDASVVADLKKIGIPWHLDN